MRRPRLAAVLPLLAADVVLVNLAILASLALRFDGAIPPRFLHRYLLAWPPLAAVTVLCLYVNGLYRGIWRYAGLRTLVSVARAVTLSTFVFIVWCAAVRSFIFPRSGIILMWLLTVTFLAALRMTPRLWREVAAGFFGAMARRSAGPRRKVLIVGAGDSGASLVRDMLSHPDRGYLPIGFVDDDPGKVGLDISGVRVLGGCVAIPEVVRESGVRVVFIAAPSAPARLTRDILAYCRQADVECLTLPALHNYAEGRAPLTQVRAVRIEDLVGREQVQIDLSQVGALLAGKTVLVTGAGGSIGSEICRQVARLAPRRLLLLDHAENGLYFCYRDLAEDPASAGVENVVLVADIKDRPRLDEICGRWRPDVVFHAAAHKHVPLLEANPCEAVLNNIAGTRNLIEAARESGVSCFVQISTDKAVRPTSIMGASKRICEMLVAAANSPESMFVSVRFGNVMDSAGSVIPLFRRQIDRGGPVTVTHREARRYFMTISEAVRLVLQSAALGRAGEILLLDMGEPVRIMDLAEQMVRLSGLVPGRDIEIREIGLRPGEKLLEQLVSESVPSRATAHERIRAYQGDPVDGAKLAPLVRELITAAVSLESEAVIAGIRRIVPDFQHAPVAATAIGARAAAPPRATMAGEATARTTAAAEPAEAEGLERISALASKPEFALRRAMRVKRAMDLAAGILLLPAALAGMLLVSLALAVEMGPPLFEQERWVGRNRRRSERRRRAAVLSINRRMGDQRTAALPGEPILLWRFRTSSDAEAAGLGFSMDQPRVAPWLRRHGLDRLPWIFGLLSGQLSLVGPEPMELDEAEKLGCDLNGLSPRFVLRPGLTGLAQTLASRDESAETRFAYDLYYAGHASPLLDLRILARGAKPRNGRPATNGNGRSGNGEEAPPERPSEEDAASTLSLAANAGRMTASS